MLLSSIIEVAPRLHGLCDVGRRGNGLVQQKGALDGCILVGISGAHALADKVLTGGPEAAEKYIKFLQAGNSVYPLDALKMAGVDLASPEPVEKTFAVLARYVDRLEALLF